MEYTEMLEALKEHEDNLPEGLTLEAVKQARESISDMYEALKGMLQDYSTNPIEDKFFEACRKAREALYKAEGGK